jgi:REP element-mobilizing transposase RayT
VPRKPRIEIPGYYHIVNRGVERRNIFLERDDFDMFEELLCKFTQAFQINLHNFCLMDNHYHLLIEITQENLSKFMRQLNMNYAIYFNKKYKRTGHLWQGRYKSWYVTDEPYLYTLIRYIEQNPLKAGIVKDLQEYPFSSYGYFLKPQQMPKCLQESWIYKSFQDDVSSIVNFITAPVDMEELKEVMKASTLVVAPETKEHKTKERLRAIIGTFENKKERNEKIFKAYEEGYSQHMIAEVIGISQQAIAKIIKSCSCHLTPLKERENFFSL